MGSFFRDLVLFLIMAAIVAVIAYLVYTSAITNVLDIGVKTGTIKRPGL